MGIALGWGLKRLGTAPGWEMSGDGNWELPGMGTALGWALGTAWDGNWELPGMGTAPGWESPLDGNCPGSRLDRDLRVCSEGKTAPFPAGLLVEARCSETAITTV